ncbi:MAG: ATP-grasp domain-containing protein [Chloroflexi bacterium]|nr:ATP-grasp domain-containing protein [Chloroflexota bacterium]
MSPNKPSRLILLASAQTYRSSPFVVAAKNLGLEIIFGQDLPLPMHKKSQAQLPLDYLELPHSTNTIVKYAEENPVGAILGLDDSSTLLASKANAVLGLSSNDPELTIATRDKHLMRKRFAEAGVPSPHFERHKISEDFENLAQKINYPCVIKPTSMSGSRGVMRADTPEEFVKYARRLVPLLVKDRCDEFLVEDYIPGVEIALEGLIDDGKLHVLAIFDKPDPLEGPFFEETIYVTPSKLSAEAQEEITRAAEQAAQALGLNMGPLHAELRYNDNGPWLLEIAGRSIGGLCSQTLRFGTETTLEELILRQAFGMDLEGAKRTAGADGVMMIPIPEAGVLKSVEGLEEAKAIPFITDIEITAKINYPLLPLPEGNSYLGFIFASGESPDEVEKAIRSSHSKLNFKITPQLNIIQ